MPLSNVKPVRLTSSLQILEPLSRRGHGPGILLIRTPAECDQANTEETLDPSPLQKWAEEGFVVAQLEVTDRHITIEEDMGRAVAALVSHEKCSQKSTFGVISNYCFYGFIDKYSI